MKFTQFLSRLSSESDCLNYAAFVLWYERFLKSRGAYNHQFIAAGIQSSGARNRLDTIVFSSTEKYSANADIKE